MPQSSPSSPPQATAVVGRHLVFFKDKVNSPYSLTQPQAYLSARAITRRTRQNIAIQPRDLPVNPTYVAQIKAVPGVQVWYTSRWFNAAVVVCDSATLASLRALPSVRGTQTLIRAQATPAAPIATNPPATAPPATTTAPGRPTYGPAYGQAQMLGAVAMHEAGFRGEGMQIAVFDGGFSGVDRLPAFAPLFEEKRLLSTYNFVERNKSVYGRNEHGTQCLSTMGANQPGFFVGTAPMASYHLLVTEDVKSEHPIEEANWLLAAEYADSVGVDIISSSLGYNDFDQPSPDYAYADLNGRTALSSRAATVAARVGMLVVNSAGNEGSSPWRYVNAPADADSILTVGAVDSVLLQRAAFSSVGPTADGRIKPALAAQGRASAVLTAAGTVVNGNGTSYACPTLAGFVAGFWQANPMLTAQQVIATLQRSGSQAERPDNELGYGIPDFSRAQKLAAGTLLPATAPVAARGQLAVYPNPARNDALFLQLTPELQNVALVVRLIDSRGRVVVEQKAPATSAPQVELRPGVLAKGTYTCDVRAGRVRRSVRFVKL
ncbi:S8 family serine peptidase [Hymenobacter roseosalivarius]|uniref:S8 family serine peptidase n=1 Tax=Hymenobacter roseosalivarius TaxID=89967 RepID=UPI001356364B|nr:S8 family serine peptidase [Hymenobacter roseosalivarius]